jgi:hypothetical protein
MIPTTMRPFLHILILMDTQHSLILTLHVTAAIDLYLCHSRGVLYHTTNVMDTVNAPVRQVSFLPASLKSVSFASVKLAR